MRSWLFLILFCAAVVAAETDAPYGIERRIPLITSRVIGSPDPPLPYAVEKTFTNIQWKAPIFITPQPGSDRLLVTLSGGEENRPSKVLRVVDDSKATETELFLELSQRFIYSFVFHPGYTTNRHVFVFTHGSGGQFARTNRISRFTVENDGSRCDPQSEHVIIEWRSEGHDGGGIVFGRDGMLYASTGDGTSDSDGWVTGQDLSELLGGIIRIDVEHPEPGKAYSVPKDNPFVGVANARPENWAYGLRNPWRLCVDERTGQIWAGNNGQDLWETAHLIRRGENYGWSVYEGSHPFYLNRKLGPTPHVPPTIEHSHAEFRSLTGGIVYYGDPFPELNGFYVYGDYSTGEIWGAHHDGKRVKALRRLAQSQIQISSFCVGHRGDLYIADHGGAIYRFVRNARSLKAPKFPTRLSETGLFLSTKEHRVQPALIPYSVNAAGWNDGAAAARFIAFPGESRIGRYTNGAVLMQTLSLGDKRIETRLLTFQNSQWAGYSYRWDERESDATLVGAGGGEREVRIKTPDGFRKQTWRYPSRAECMTCHSRAANFVLGLTEAQLNKAHDYDGNRDNQLRTLKHIDVFSGSLPKDSDSALVDPYNSTQDLDRRARSYLHVNCSVCHVEAGGGNAKMELGVGAKSERMNLIGARPQHDTFGIDNAMLVFPGDPDRSILLQRISRRGRGQMPPLVTKTVDESAVVLFRNWISNMKPLQQFVRDWKFEELAPTLDRIGNARSLEKGRNAFEQTGCAQCHRFAGGGGSVGPDLTGIGRRLSPRDLLESILLPSKSIAEGYATTELETKSGDEISGRIEREDDRTIVIRPANVEQPITVRKSDLRRRNLSQTSNMPTGILNTLSGDQILDLLAYLVSDGDSAGTGKTGAAK